MGYLLFLASLACGFSILDLSLYVKLRNQQRRDEESLCELADIVLWRLEVLERVCIEHFGEQFLFETRRQLRIEKGIENIAS